MHSNDSDDGDDRHDERWNSTREERQDGVGRISLEIHGDGVEKDRQRISVGGDDCRDSLESTSLDRSLSRSRMALISGAGRFDRLASRSMWKLFGRRRFRWSRVILHMISYCFGLLFFFRGGCRRARTARRFLIAGLEGRKRETQGSLFSETYSSLVLITRCIRTLSAGLTGLARRVRRAVSRFPIVMPRMICAAFRRGMTTILRRHHRRFLVFLQGIPVSALLVRDDLLPSMTIVEVQCCAKTSVDH